MQLRKIYGLQFSPMSTFQFKHLIILFFKYSNILYIPIYIQDL